MKYSIALLSSSAALVQGVAFFTNTEINPVPGEPFELTWQDADGPVSIVLRTGDDPLNLDTVTTLASGLTSGSTTVTLDPEELPSGQYAFEVVDGTESNYSLPFPFVGSAAELPDTSGSSSSGVTATKTDEDSTTSPTADATDSETSSSRRPTPSPTNSSDDAEDTSVPGVAPAVSVSSPLALILSAVAAMMYFN